MNQAHFKVNDLQVQLGNYRTHLQNNKKSSKRTETVAQNITTAPPDPPSTTTTTTTTTNNNNNNDAISSSTTTINPESIRGEIKKPEKLITNYIKEKNQHLEKMAETRSLLAKI
jgi:hypothetical protein